MVCRRSRRQRSDVTRWQTSVAFPRRGSARQTQDRVAKDGSPILGLPRSRKGAWRRGPLELSVGGDLFLRDGNLRWRRRAVSDGNPRSPARSPNCRDCAFLPVRDRSLCRDRNIAANNPGNNTEETDCVAGVGGFELRYPCAQIAFADVALHGVTDNNPLFNVCQLSVTPSPLRRLGD